MAEQDFNNEEEFDIDGGFEAVDLDDENFGGFDEALGVSDEISDDELFAAGESGDVDTSSEETGVIVGKMGGECYLFADGAYDDLLKRIATIQRISELQGKDINFKVLTIDPDMLLKLRNNAELVSETFKPYFPEKDDISVKVELED